jgi:hypothetical protein
MRSYIIAIIFVLCLGSALAATGRRAAAQSPEATPAPSVSISLDETCSPTTFRPHEWVVVTCVQRLTNRGDKLVSGVYTGVSNYRFDPVPPSYYVMWTRQDDQFLSVGTQTTIYPSYDIPPGETVQAETVVLFNMVEGTFEFELIAFLTGDPYTGDEPLASSQRITLAATLGAPEPPNDLIVELRPLTEQAPEGMSSALYDTTITNRGSTAISDLNVTLRSGGAALVTSEPVFESQNQAVELASWNLASFGNESLAPGESLVLHTTYGVPEGQDCAYPEIAAVVQATVSGERGLYGARSDEGRVLGACPPGYGGGEPAEVPTPSVSGGGETALLPPTTSNATPSVALPHAGDGTTSSDGQVSSRGAIAIVGIALLLFGTAIAHRRTRSRRS